MRRFLSTLLVLVIFIFVFTACGTDETSSDEGTSKEGSSSNQSAVDVSSKFTNEHQALLNEKTFKINYPDGKNISEGRCHIFYSCNEYFIILVVDRSNAYDITEIPDKLSHAFFMSDRYFSYGMPKEDPTIDITSTENIKINGIDVLKYDGTVEVSEDTNTGKPVSEKMRGYAFVLDDCSIELVGVVATPEAEKSTLGDEESFYNAMISDIEEMIQTIRCE